MRYQIETLPVLLILFHHSLHATTLRVGTSLLHNTALSGAYTALFNALACSLRLFILDLLGLQSQAQSKVLFTKGEKPSFSLRKRSERDMVAQGPKKCDN